MASAHNRQIRRSRRPSSFRNGDATDPGQVLAGETVGVGGDFRIRPRRNYFAAAHAWTGTEVHKIIGGAHRVLVVFYDDDGVAHVAQFFEAAEQTIIVARMKADARFIQDIEDANKAAADLSGQSDALRLAAGEGGGGTLDCEIMKTDVEQKADASAQFLEHFDGNGPLHRSELFFEAPWACFEPPGDLADGKSAYFRQRLVADLDGPRCALRRLPWQVGQRTTRMYFSSCIRRGPAAVFLKLLNN